MQLSIGVLEDRYKDLRIKLGRVPIRKEFGYTSSFEQRFGKWQKFVSRMGDDAYRHVYSKDELKQIILEFTKKNGRPPSADEMKRPSSKVFQNEFGTWNNALAECGFEVKHPIYIADDGHKCYSRMELYVDNFLFHNNIQHEKDVKYPFHKLLNKSTKKTCDWVTDDGKYIELFGLMRKEHYRERVTEKEQLSKEHNLNLIKLFPEDLKCLKTIFNH